MWIIVVWAIVPIIIDDITIDSIIARLGLGSASIVLIIAATIIKIY